MKDFILKAENVSYTVDKRNSFSGFESVEIIKNISFGIERGNVLGIAGESGSGKSTLAKILTGIYSPSSGRIETKFIKDWSNSQPKPIQILFQNDGELINPFRKVKDVLNEAFELKTGTKNNFSKDVNELLNILQLPQTINENKGSQLSGGEQQRIALARILIIEPELLILDEPFSSQDVESQLNLINLIKKIKADFNLNVICISHDLRILRNFADEILIMFKGEIAENGITNVVFANPKHDYTKFLLSAESLSLSYNEIQSFHLKYEQDQRNKNS